MLDLLLDMSAAASTATTAAKRAMAALSAAEARGEEMNADAAVKEEAAAMTQELLTELQTEVAEGSGASPKTAAALTHAVAHVRCRSRTPQTCAEASRTGSD